MTASNSIRVALVEDQSEHARDLRAILTSVEGFDCATVCVSAEEALARLPVLSLDVILMDIHLGGISGIECVWRLKEMRPHPPIMVCTALESEDLILEAIVAGASGYVLKHDPPDLIRAAVQNVARGCFVMTRPVARDLQQFFQVTDSASEAALRLSPRERQVLREIAHGYMDTEIVEHLKIEMPTLRTYVRSLFHKLHVGTRTEAAARYWQSRDGRFHRLAKLVQRLGEEARLTSPKRPPRRGAQN